MRTLNFILISAIGVFTLLLTLIAMPTLGERPLSHWALTMGMFSSASVVSLLYAAASLIPPTAHKKSQTVVLATYFPTLVISVITGAFWGLVGHVMETQKTTFETAFYNVNTIIYCGYGVAALIFIGSLIYLIKQIPIEIPAKA